MGKFGQRDGGSARVEAAAVEILLVPIRQS